MSPQTVTLQRSKDMLRQQGLLLRGSRWYSNFKVPLDLRDALGKEHIREALGTSDSRETARRIGYERGRWNGIFDNEREKLVLLNPPATTKTKRLLTAISDQEAFEYATRYLVSSERDFRDWMNREGRLLVWLCFHKGYRGGIKKGPYSDALKTLAERGIIRFDHKRKFYVLSNACKDAAAALSSIAGDPLLALMGVDPSEFVLQPSGLPPIRVRE